MNIKKSIISYFKHSKMLRGVFMYLITKKGTYRRRVKFESQYQNVVRGGEVMLAVPSFQSEYFLDPRSHLAMRVISNGDYESELIPLFRKVWQGGSIINVGANVGFWAVALPRLLDNVQRVVAIEPNPSAFSLLTRNIDLNGLKDIVQPVQVLISAESKDMEMEIIPGRSEYSSIGSIVHPSVAELPKEKIIVPSLPLDEVVTINSGKSDFNLMIVDVEGAEYLVFLGSKKFIMNNRPVVLFECSDAMLAAFGNSVAQIIEFWQEIKYVVVNVGNMKKVKNESFYYDGEVLAIPEEKYEQIMSKIKE
jgi:FkbM family methyltransferase